MKHTKGEWIAKRNNSFYDVTIKGKYDSDYDGNNLAINVILFSKDGEVLSLTEEGEANAKLIAAAPELLEQLIACEAELKKAGYGELARSEINKAINKACQ